jgi:hypothetical protein
MSRLTVRPLVALDCVSALADVILRPQAEGSSPSGTAEKILRCAQEDRGEAQPDGVGDRVEVSLS